MMSEHCLSEASLRAWVKQLQIISERSSGREFLCNFLVGTRKLEKKSDEIINPIFAQIKFIIKFFIFFYKIAKKLKNVFYMSKRKE